MIEDEAKTKWCPFAVMSHHNAPTGGNRCINDIVNMNAGLPHSCMCVGSECMAWRSTDREARPTPPDGEPDFFEAGYCGLAGKP